jgi:nitrogen regulatory protein PII
MMLITAVVPASSVLAIRRALAIFDVVRYTVAPAYQTDDRKFVHVYKAARWVGPGTPAMRFEVVVPNSDVGDIVRIMTRAAPVRYPVAIWTIRIDQLYDIHTGRTGLDAL